MSYLFGSQSFGDSPFGGRLIPDLTDLLVDDKINPLQLINITPVLSWNYRQAFGIEQTAYQVQVSVSSTFATIFWDTGQILGSEKSIVYNGPDLVKGTIYYWRVRAKDDELYSDYKDASFRLNRAPILSNLKIDGNVVPPASVETTPPIVGTDVPPADPYFVKLFTNNTKPVISWTYSDLDGDTQQSFTIRIGIGNNFNVYRSGTVFSDETSYVLPEELNRGVEYVAEVTISDGAESSTETIVFTVNGIPIVSQLLVEGRSEPKDIAVDAPLFSWNYTDIDSNPQYLRRIKIGTADESGDIWDSQFVEDWHPHAIYAGPELPARVVLYIQVEVQDRPGATSIAAKTTFMVNHPPTKPEITYPAGGEEFNGDSSITVLWNPSTDPDADVFTYKLEITDKFQENTDYQLVADNIPQTAVSYVLDLSKYRRDYTYGLRLTASDGLASSESSITESFFSILNHKPSMPQIVQPVGGLALAFSAVIRWNIPVMLDIDEDPVQFVVEYMNLDDPNPTGVPIAVTPSDQDTLPWNISQLRDGNYIVRIKAVDIYGKSSDYSSSDIFTIDNIHQTVDIVKHNGNIFISQNDGQVFKASSRIWGFEENFDEESINEVALSPYKDPNDIIGATLKDGALVVTTGTKQTFLVTG